MEKTQNTNDHLFTVNYQKKLRNLNKKLRDIEALYNIETKSESQLEKISQKKNTKEQIVVITKEMEAFLVFDKENQLKLKKEQKTNDNSSLMMNIVKATLNKDSLSQHIIDMLK